MLRSANTLDIKQGWVIGVKVIVHIWLGITGLDTRSLICYWAILTTSACCPDLLEVISLAPEHNMTAANSTHKHDLRSDCPRVQPQCTATDTVTCQDRLCWAQIQSQLNVLPELPFHKGLLLQSSDYQRGKQTLRTKAGKWNSIGIQQNRLNLDSTEWNKKATNIYFLTFT